MRNRVYILGVGIDPITKADLLASVREGILQKRNTLISYVHVKGLNVASETPWLRDYFNRSDIVYCDGVGVRLGAYLLGRSLPERFTLADWIDDLLAAISEAGGSLFLLGNPPGVAEKSLEVFTVRFPKVQPAGAHHGFFDMTPGSQENEAVVAKINASGADVLLVGMGIPLQEKWICENRARLNVRVIMAVGGVFEYFGGGLNRAPGWVTDNGFEWLSLLIQEPLRYWKRYLFGNPLFILRVLKQRLTGNDKSNVENYERFEP